MDLGKNIQELRKVNSMTAKELSERLDISPSFISSIENNSSKLSLNTLRRICDVLGVSLAEFFNTELSPVEQKLISTIKQMSEQKQEELFLFLDGLFSEET